ncbi:MAG TPA: FmdB family zinc ribbon protein [Thermomicrobiales bacterium]|nr:FmdB family zinc ribbon protein [Thermomicrobiales bacterium]
MPLYDYACEECGHRFEVRQSFSDDPLTVCPECEGHIRRVIHPSGIIFKGSGWYITDSRKPESNGADSSSAESKSETAAAAAD